MPRLSTIREFPICQENHFISAVIPESYFPVNLTKTELFKWLYRVKSWEVDINLTITETGGGVTTLVGTGTIPQGITIGGGDPYADETELACNVWMQGVTENIVNGGTYTPSAGAPSSFDIVGYIELATLLPADEYAGPPPDSYFLRLTDGDEADEEAAEDNDYLPSLLIGVMTSYPTFIVQNGPNPTPEATLSVSFDGKTVPIYSIVNAGDIVTGSLTITPYEYWEHDPGDGGGPVWNATTGAQERDPFSC